MTVRMISCDDTMDIVGLAREHHASSRYAHLPFHGERVMKLATACCSLPNYGCVVYHNGERIAGYMAMTVEPYVFADITIARELAVYIAPSDRSFTLFSQMRRFMESWAIGKGVHTLDVGITSPHTREDAERYGELYRRAGYEYHGACYRKEMTA